MCVWQHSIIPGKYASKVEQNKFKSKLPYPIKKSPRMQGGTKIYNLHYEKTAASGCQE